MVIEDNATLVVAGLRNFFRPERDQIRVSEVTVSVSEAIEKIDANSFEVIILDLIIPDTRPTENIQALKRKFPSKPVVIYSSMDSKFWRRTMWNAGASGYVHKNDGRDKLKNAIADAFSGKSGYSETFQNDRETGPLYEIQGNTLSIIEKEILKMLVKGIRYKEISNILKIKSNQIETTIRQLRLKFKAKSTHQLICILLELGLL